VSEEVIVLVEEKLREVSKRISALPPDLSKILADDLKATIIERLTDFERLAQKRHV
jgi:hypothetical protein